MLTLQRPDRAEVAAGERDERVVCLVRRAQAGDEAAFAELYQRYATAVFRLVSQHVDARPREALTVVARIFARAHQEIATYDPWTRSFDDWLGSIVCSLLVGSGESSRYQRGWSASPRDARPSRRA